MASKQFDLAGALTEKGFEKVSEIHEGKNVYITFSKSYEKEAELAWYGKDTVRFTATVSVALWDSGKGYSVLASFSNGKVKEYAYDKRAYNAIADTIKYNGFSI